MEVNIVEIITTIVRESATAALAVVTLYWLRHVYEDRLETQKQQAERWQQQMECEREDKLMINETLSAVAQRMGEMTEVLRDFRRSDSS